MGTFLNRGNNEFQRVVNSKIYVDKADMIDFFNSVIDSEQSYVAVSRPRRFGKSITANMIAAYFEKGVDSRFLFENRKLGECDNWDVNLNKYNTIRIDMADILASRGTPEAALDFLEKELLIDLDKSFPNIIDNDADIATALDNIHKETGEKFIIIIDEWECFFRDEKNNDAVQRRYINLLRGLFKGNRSKNFLALAYITGILPIKRYNSESALNNFDEYTMTEPVPLEKYIGFTENEVQALCDEYHMDFNTMKEWYDGYVFGDEHIYGPNSVVKAIHRGSYQSYWSQTVAFNSLSSYITMNFEGLKDDIISMIGGNSVPVKIRTYQNDMVSFKNKHDVLTCLIHLGYLSYDREHQEVFIPNKEVRICFEDVLEDAGWNEVARSIENSKKLLLIVK